MTYCKPLNAGLNSETQAVCRRLGRLLTTLDVEINPNVCAGDITSDIRRFRELMCDLLKAEGWSMSYHGGNRMRVRPPGHPEPYGRKSTGAGAFGEPA